jgi:hypothetical protein
VESYAATTRTRLDVLAVLLAVHMDLGLAPDALRLVPGSTLGAAAPAEYLAVVDLTIAGEVALIEVDAHGVTITLERSCYSVTPSNSASASATTTKSSRH